MTPEFIKTDKYIEVIGHYDDKVLCAKMTLLADLYAVEHRSGYAKFPIECEDKLKSVDSKLEFYDEDSITINSEQLNAVNWYFSSYTWSTLPSGKYIENTTTAESFSTDNFVSVSGGKVIYLINNEIIQYNGEDVIPTDSIVASRSYTTREDVQQLSTPSLTLSSNTLTVSNIDDNATSIQLKRNGADYKNLFLINDTYTNVTASSHVGLIANDETVTISITADGTSYKVPTTAPTVTGATGTYTRTSDTAATLVISGATQNVSFTMEGEAIASGYTLSYAESSPGTFTEVLVNDTTVSLPYTLQNNDIIVLTVGAFATWARINNVDYIELGGSTTLSLTGTNIVISTDGSTEGPILHTFTINYTE